MKKNQKNEQNKDIYVNQNLLNIISPSGISFDNNYADIGEGVGKIFCISRYPSELDYGWLSDIVNLPGAAATVEYRYSPEDIMIAQFNRRISELKSARETERKESEIQRYEHQIEDLKNLINRISVKREPVGFFNVLLHIQDANEELLAKRIRNINSRVRIHECDMQFLKFKQRQALESMSPWGIPNAMVYNVGERNMPMSTFVGGFPMAAVGLNDKDGYVIGEARNRMVVMWNMWLRGKDRTNSNVYIQGIPGTGKSTLIKFFQLLEYAINDTTQIVWDAEREFIDMARHPWLNADVIDCASGNRGRVNPLQIRYTPHVTEEDLNPGESIVDYTLDDSLGFSDMALHIQNLRQFFGIYFGMENFKDPGVRMAFEKALIETYRQAGISWDTDISKLKNEDFPTCSDFYDVTMDMSKEDGISSREKENFERLGEMLFSMGQGADSFLWNGITTLTSKSKYIVLDTSKLLEMDDNIRNAQFFNLCMWQWHRMSQNRSEKVLAHMDEGYLYADPDFPQLMKNIRNISKRGRKYEAGLCFITHSPVDVLDPQVKRFSEAVIDNSCYKFLFGSDGKGLAETIELFKLSEKEIKLLESKTRGKCLFCAGNIRLELRVDVPDMLIEMMGKAGGR